MIKKIVIILIFCLLFCGCENEHLKEDIMLGAVVISDTFVEQGVDEVALENHSPDTGTGWVELIDTVSGGGSLIVYGFNDHLVADKSDCGLGEGNLYYENDIVSSDNYEVSVTQVNGDTSDDYNYICCRIQDADNMYCLEFNETDTDLIKRVSGSWSSLDTGSGIADGSTVKLICDGTSISAEDDGSEIVSATDSSISSAGYAGIGLGQIGYGSGKDCGSQLLDDFSVNTLAGSPAEEASSTRRIIIN